MQPSVRCIDKSTSVRQHRWIFRLRWKQPCGMYSRIGNKNCGSRFAIKKIVERLPFFCCGASMAAAMECPYFDFS